MSFAPRLALSLALILGSSTGVLSAQVLRVRAGAPPGGDGSSWASAIGDLQTALLRAQLQPTSALWIAAGTYRPSVSDRTVSFVLPDGVALRGGFAGTETSPDQRDLVANVTVLDGDLLGDDQPGFVNYGDNSFRVVSGSGLGSVEIDSLTVRGGSRGTGTGLFLVAGDVQLLRLVAKENLGIGNNNDGAGMWVSASTLTADDCEFSDNRTTTGGGALLEGPMLATFRRCTFRGNFATAGAGLAASISDSSSSLTLEECRFEGNAGCAGGGLWLVGVPTLVDHCRFIANGDRDSCGVGSGGGAIKVEVGEPLTILNSLFVDNRRHQLYVGGGGAVTVELCTFSNEANAMPSLRAQDGSLALANSIVWGNGELQAALGPAGSVQAHHSDVRMSGAGLPGPGNVDVDPGLEPGPAGDVRLSAGSPCIDAGDPALSFAGADLERDSRLLDGDLDGAVVIDQGADEFGPLHLDVLGTPAPGNTLTFVTTGPSGLGARLFVGLPGTRHFPQVGTLFLNPTSALRLPWPNPPSSVPLLVPPGVSGLLRVQELAFGGGALVLSNWVPLAF